MNKILIEIICGMNSKAYDFWIPKKMGVGDVFEKIIEDICEYEGDNSLLKERESICYYHKTQQVFLNRSQTVVEAGIKSGDCILII